MAKIRRAATAINRMFLYSLLDIFLTTMFKCRL
jgi:hypothetical protein